MNKKGFTVVELMTTFALIAVISILLIRLTITLKEIYVNGDMKTALLTKQGNMTDKINKDLKENTLVGLTSCGINCVNFEYATDTKVLKINKDKKILSYGNYSIKLGDGGYFGTVDISNYESDIGSIINLNIPIYHKLVKGNFGININYQAESINFDKSITFDVVEENKKIICKRAVTLHTEECTQTDENYYCNNAGYTKTGSKKTNIITYGNYGIKGKLASGDAFDCDVNGDGIYNAENERFYYLTDIDKATASLIYYSNTLKGKPDNTSNSLIAYYSEAEENWHGPVTAITNLPTTSEWKNVTLKNTTRQILNEKGGTTTIGGTLPIKFSYNRYAARLLTIEEINNACNITAGSVLTGEIDNCNYLLENTIYSDKNSVINGYWLETVKEDTNNRAWRVIGGTRRIAHDPVTLSNSQSVRPVIEVSKENIAY